MAVVVVESVVVRLATPAGSSLAHHLVAHAIGGRTAWRLPAATCSTFSVAVADDADTGVLDLVLEAAQALAQGLPTPAGAAVGHRRGGRRTDGRLDVDSW